jgi:hypothetical protein
MIILVAILVVFGASVRPDLCNVKHILLFVVGIGFSALEMLKIFLSHLPDDSRAADSNPVSCAMAELQ